MVEIVVRVRGVWDTRVHPHFPTVAATHSHTSGCVCVCRILLDV